MDQVLYWLYKNALDSEWQIHHAAENRYCPYCAHKNLDNWRDQAEHHVGCEYVKMMEEAKKILIERGIKCPT